VIALDDVFGMASPAAAAMATTIGVVRLPGSPPTLCLSMMVRSQESCSPARAIAAVSATVSSSVSGSADPAVMNAASCTSL
jgi:hypothetical protein